MAAAKVVPWLFRLYRDVMVADTTTLYYFIFATMALVSGFATCFRDRIAWGTGYFIMVPLLVTFLLMITSRPIFSDSLNYQDFFFSIHGFGYSPFEIGFEFYTMAFNRIANWPFYLLSFPALLLVSSLTLYKTIRSVPNYGIAIFVLLSWPFFWAYSATGLRQSLAISIGLFAIGALAKRHFFLAGITLVLSTLFHSSAIFLFIAVAAYWRQFKLKPLLILWVGSVLVSPVLPIENLFLYLPFDLDLTSKYGSYFDESYGLDYRSGIRADFVLFSALPIVAFQFRRAGHLVITPHLQFVFHTYLMLNIVANLLADIPYSDRVYSYSWLLAPVVIASVWEELPQYLRACFATFLFLLVIFYSKHWLGI